MRYAFSILFAVLFVGLVAFVIVHNHHPADFQTLHFTETAELGNTVGTTTISLAIADTPVEQETGLSNQPSLAPDHGLLFVFNTPSTYGFWMKEMNFPLDIMWLDASYHIVYVQKDFLPSTYPMVAYPTIPAQFVLEVPAGFTTTHQISDGSLLTISK